jgi:hypothetical protein
MSPHRTSGSDNFRLARHPDTIAEVTKRSASPAWATAQVGPRLTHWTHLVLPLRRAFVTINSVSSIA